MSDDQATTTANPPGQDNDLPVGDFPGGSRALVVLGWIAWGAWFIFLIAMMIYRLNTATR